MAKEYIHNSFHSFFFHVCRNFQSEILKLFVENETWIKYLPQDMQKYFKKTSTKRVRGEQQKLNYPRQVFTNSQCKCH